jgi:ubiquinone/menaquinone biosynthesis C-methylase UbiE
MRSGLIQAGMVVTAVLCVIFLFFFMTTRGTLLWRRLRGNTQDPASHVYSIYGNRHLIRWVDCQPVISAILLCQYGRLVDRMVADLRQTDLTGQRCLMTSCAFGNVMPRVAQAALASGATELEVIDVIDHELTHAQRKLQSTALRQTYRLDNATHLDVASDSVAVNLMFFLLHELTPEHKVLALQEAVRVLKPGGKFYLAEFHRPHARWLRCLSWLYFKVFEPWGLALWAAQDPLAMLEATGQVHCTRQVIAGGNFQVIVATKHPTGVCA